MSKFMQRALDLAKRGRPSPNPKVGCVIVKSNRIIAEGYHKQAGAAHAEIVALRRAGKSARGATMYVTLEPCCHFGRTPPCTEAIIAAEIKNIEVATTDPNPCVNGGGIHKLRKAGIKVSVGCLKDDANRLNEFFFNHASKGTPFVILKSAMTLDGRIATQSGKSRWITCTQSRHMVHELRNEVDAILVGINTVIKDDPRLTCRLKGGTDPLRVIVDSGLRIPLNAKVLKDNNVLIATTGSCSASKKGALEKKGVKIITVNKGGKSVDLKSLMKSLGKSGVSSVLIEGGSKINTSALAAGIIDKVMFFMAPSIMGRGVPAVGDLGAPGKSIRIKSMTVKTIGCDLLIEGYL